MSVKEILDSGANITLAISPHDLEEFANLILTAREQERRDIEELLSINSVCSILDVDRVTLWRWEKAKYLMPITIGKAKKYKKTDILNLINK